VARLIASKKDASGRILVCRDEPVPVENDPLFVHVIENNKATRVVKGIIGVVKSTNLPDQFDSATGIIAPLSLGTDLLEKSHFFIDTATGYMVFQRTKNSPTAGLLAYYLVTKLAKIVTGCSTDAQIRRDAVKKIQAASAKGEVKMFSIKVKRTALPRANLLGPEADKALQTLASLPGAESIGITVGLEKRKRKGGISIDPLLSNIKRFLGTQTSTNAISDVEQASFKLADEEIDLITQKFTVRIEIPNHVMNSRNVNSKAVVDLMAAEYDRIKANI
jgi:hypothetical protein